MTIQGSIVLQVQAATVSFSGHSVVEGASFKVSSGEIVTMVGPNGAGKTTLVRVALGLIKPQKGHVFLKPGTRVAYMPQRLQMDNTIPITVERFMSLNMPHRISAQDIACALEMVQADTVKKAPLQKISGGELQRVLLARCVLRRPELLVLDEPSQGVDMNGQQELYGIIKRIRDEYRCAVLMVSHDLHLVMAATDQVICLNRHICCSGCPESIKQHPEFLALFGDSLQNLAVYTHHHDHHHDAHGNVVLDEKV